MKYTNKKNIYLFSIIITLSANTFGFSTQNEQQVTTFTDTTKDFISSVPSIIRREPYALANQFDNITENLLKPTSSSIKNIRETISPTQKLAAYMTAVAFYEVALPEIPVLYTLPKFTRGEYGAPNSIISRTGKGLGTLLLDLPKAVAAQAGANWFLNKINVDSTQKDPVVNTIPIAVGGGLLLHRWKSQPDVDNNPSSLTENELLKLDYKFTPRQKAHKNTFDWLYNNTQEEKLKKLLENAKASPTLGGRILITGESGTGKTTWANNAVKVLGRTSIYLNAKTLKTVIYAGSGNARWSSLKELITTTLQPGDAIIIDEVDTFISDQTDTGQGNNQTDARKDFMEFLDQISEKNLITILITNLSKDKIHPQAKDRPNRTMSNNTKTGLAKQTAEQFKNISTQLLTVLTNPDEHYKRSGNLPSCEASSEINFGWGLVAKEKPSAIERLGVVDFTLREIQITDKTLAVNNAPEFSAYIAKYTPDQTQSFINNTIVRKIWDKHKQESIPVIDIYSTTSRDIINKIFQVNNCQIPKLNNNPFAIDENELKEITTLYKDYRLTADNHTKESFEKIALLTKHIADQEEKKGMQLSLLGVYGIMQSTASSFIQKYTLVGPLAYRLGTVNSLINSILHKKQEFKALQNISSLFSINNITDQEKAGETLNLYLNNPKVPSLAHAVAMQLQAEKSKSDVNVVKNQLKDETFFFGLDGRLITLDENNQPVYFEPNEKE